MLKSLAIVGAGRVGRALGRRLRAEGWKIGAVVTRSETTARKAVRFIGGGQAHGAVGESILRSRVILVAVPDDAVHDVAVELASLGGEQLRGEIVLHTSGALDSRALGPVKEKGAFVGSMHPLQTFTGKNVPALDRRIVTIEGDGRAVRVARGMVRSLGGSPVSIAGEKKVLYHAAAAMAAGHVLAIEEAATQLLVSLGMVRREALRALLPLTRQVLDNFERLGPQVAWTGPLSRNDYKTVAAHCRQLQDVGEEFRSAYRAVNGLAARVRAEDPSAMLAELESVVLEVRATMKAKGSNA